MMASKARHVLNVTGYIESSTTGSAQPPPDPMFQNLTAKGVHVRRHSVGAEKIVYVEIRVKCTLARSTSSLPRVRMVDCALSTSD